MRKLWVGTVPLPGRPTVSLNLTSCGVFFFTLHFFLPYHFIFTLSLQFLSCALLCLLTYITKVSIYLLCYHT
ncbi:hypothetical protein L873DRAFT_43592 [Choiromyces venosus 120613-1]|uniref:Uncharacterized protein n=1 Tax=Choiromyces venosus 120613-1 TaxID=1336337 RepID=A0A3N4K137_9PEZI|nr:hypothetical protein L873DRAFT_43592 [Choiromyces venosus 120613-1]